MNDKKLFCDVLITQFSNNTDVELLEKYEVLSNIIKNKSFDIFKFLWNTMDKKIFIKYLFNTNKYNAKPFGEILQFWPLNMIAYIFDTIFKTNVNIIHDFILISNDEIFRLWRWSNHDIKVIEFVLNELEIKNLKLIRYLNYRCK